MLEMLEELEAAAVKCAATPAWPLSDTDIIDCLDVAHRLQQQVAAILLHLISAADSRGIARDQGCRTTAGWLRTRLRLDPFAARTLVEQATALDRHDAVDEALCCGAIDVRQAAAITDALDELSKEVDAETKQQAATVLLSKAGEFETAKLRTLGTRILAHVAPEVADRKDEEAAAREEQRAHRSRGFTLGLPMQGMVRVSGILSVEDTAVVRAALDPLCSPRAGDTRTPAQQRADALVETCRLALRTGELPDNGGEPPQVAVSVPFDVLTTSLGTGHLDTGEKLTAEAVRRLACDARILPIVLGGQGQVLDAGRSRRLVTGPLRRALVFRDGGCSFPGCDRPPRWCDGHHLVSWIDGGPTDLDNLVLLCKHHHRLIHHDDWTIQLGADRHPEFLPPAHLDPTRTPRRNIFHRRT